jgi:hypothetical protein
MFRRITHGRPKGDGEEGMAMVMVIAIGAVLTILVSVAITYSVGGLRKATDDEAWNSAMAAAYAGVEEYQSRLANDSTYLQYGNPAASFSSTSTVALPTGANVNAAFGIGAAGTWATVAQSGGASKYRYEIDNSKYYSTGTLRIRSTGLVGKETRTIVADLRQQGFIDFLWFTDYEIQDPAISGANETTCTKYAWAGRPSSGCSEIAFSGGDVLSGPVHSNDTIRICSAQFKGAVTTAYNPATGNKYSARDSNNNSCSGQVFDLAKPVYSPIVGMPATNSQLKKETRADLTAEVPRPGCLYTGPTSIVFKSNGDITVRSPWTKATNVVGDPATSGTTPAQCGTVGSAGLGSTAGATFALPDNNVIYVQSVPTVTTDPNYWASAALPTGLTCVGMSGSKTGSSNTSPGAGNGIGYPKTDEKAPSTTTYGCRSGDVFVSGTLDGHATVAAENYIYVVGDLKYDDSNDDMLGLVGNNAIWVWNPVKSNGDSALGNTNRRIDAAMLSVAHTFQVQNYSQGDDRGTLTVNGAIAQKFRGIVRNGDNGYIKNYVYDPRLKYTAPPKFLSPVSTTYGVNVWVEVKAAFKADGSAN